MTAMELLNWVRGPGFAAAIIIFVLGVAVRLFEIFMAGRKPDISAQRADPVSSGLGTVWRRFYWYPNLRGTALITLVAGYVFHVGLFVVVFLLTQHVDLFRRVFGIGWPALPSSLVDFAAVITMAALVALMVTRLRDPVRRHLSELADYLVWMLTFLPVVTGYMAVHRFGLEYTWMLALHILSAELLIAAIPFTRLSHSYTLFLSRWYNGAVYGRRGVKA